LAYFTKTPGRLAPWIPVFISILDSEVGEALETPTTDSQMIQQMNKTPIWKLKGIIGRITQQLFGK